MDQGNRVEDADFWLFGYGSLIWKPPPHHGNLSGQSEIARLRHRLCATLLAGQSVGASLQFSADSPFSTHQKASEDHRGTLEFPGRVVTLIERSHWKRLHDEQGDLESEQVWGAAYHIMPSKVEEVKQYLRIREINGYSVQYACFRPANRQLPDIRCLVYIGMPDNPQFLGPLPLQDVAERINRSIGPSGHNRDYLLQLEQSLQDLSTESSDVHVSDLARRVRTMLRANENGESGDVPSPCKISNVEDQKR